MTEKEAVANVKKQLEGIKKANECGLATRGEFNKDIEAIETVLNLLEKKDKETEYWKNGFERELESNRKNIIEIIKKDKIIDLMAEQLAGLAIFDIEKDEALILGDKEEVKQYFERK